MKGSCIKLLVTNSLIRLITGLTKPKRQIQKRVLKEHVTSVREGRNQLDEKNPPKITRFLNTLSN